MQRPQSRRSVLTGIAAAGTAALAGCLGDDPDIDPDDVEIALVEDFSDGFGWTKEAAIGPEVDLDDWEWSIELSDEEVHVGERAVEVYTEGRYDDGLAWLVTTIDIEPGLAYHAEASVHAWSYAYSDNNLRRLACYLGPDRPEDQSDFPEPDWDSTDEGETDYGGIRDPLNRAEGWYEHTFEWQSPTLDTDTLYFAVGVGVVWESDLTYYLDDIEVVLEPV